MDLRTEGIPPYPTCIVYDSFVHGIDTAVWLYDRMPSMVFARSESVRSEYDDSISAIMGFGKGCTAILRESWLASSRRARLDVTCVNGAIRAELVSQKIDGEEKHGGRQELMLMAARNFLDAIDGKTKPVITPTHAARIARIAEAVLLSSKKGMPLYLDIR